MEQKINCRTKTDAETKKVRVKIIKAPIVSTIVLRNMIIDRARALVL